MADRPSFDQRRAWLLDTLDRTIDTFGDMPFDEFEDNWRLQREAIGCLVAIGQDLYEATGHADADLSRRYRNLRNTLAHAYATIPPTELWAALQDLPELRDSVEQHRPPSPRTVETGAPTP